MNNLEEFRFLDDDTAQNLCKVICWPGGMMDNPAFVAASGAATVAAARILEWVPYPGFLISTWAEMNLQLMCYFLHYREHMLHVTITADITLAAVQSIRGYKRWEESHEDVEPPEINDKDWAHTFESIDEWLCGCLGETSKIPLAYIILDTVAIMDNPAAPTTWPSKVDELIGCAPHGDAVDNYLTDNVKVWEKISNLTCSHECWTYVCPTQYNQNGHLAYMVLKNHYLGPNNMNHQVNEAETKLKVLSYHGERRHWNFEKYVHMHQDQHTILQGLVEHGYAGIDDQSKVCHLLDGIKTNELDMAKGQIWALLGSKPTSMNVLLCSKILSTIRKLLQVTWPPLPQLAPSASETMKKWTVTFSPTCLSKIATTPGKSTASCQRQRNSV